MTRKQLMKLSQFELDKRLKMSDYEFMKTFSKRQRNARLSWYNTYMRDRVLDRYLGKCLCGYGCYGIFKIKEKRNAHKRK